MFSDSLVALVYGLKKYFILMWSSSFTEPASSVSMDYK